ncbi:hypothetical protein GP486_002254 [Trichoglossum hirsutum]|uniref:SET domain-containing protein n=1 Tax=Trichoglossum hirsutum TaxID=265104 RepID=A0A9P8LFE7_9PEZI|nr:hypothetical protein GP486_002254 [Trichoglossum hirsutum]
MDTHNVSSIPEYMQYLLTLKQNLRNAESCKGQHPKDRKSRDQLVLRFMLQLMMRSDLANVRRDEVRTNLRTTFVPLPYSPCLNSLLDLAKVMINDLLLETHHRGKFLVLRSVTPPTRMNAIMAVVEDEDGDAILLQLYYQEEEDERAAKEILGEGTIVIVKEPYLKLMSDGEYGIRVDHLSDIIFLPRYDGRVPKCWKLGLAERTASVNTWKTKGNGYFKECNYHAAIEQTKRFDAALSDLESVSIAPKPAEKVLFRKAQALSSLQRYRECCEVLKFLRMDYPNNMEAKGELSRAINRLLEQESGKYKFKQLHAEAFKLCPPHLDHATYVGPVTVKDSGSRGRGLFTTKAVKAGDLLLCEKAFAHAFADDTTAASRQKLDLTLLINPGTDTVTIGGRAELIQLIVQKLYRNPSLMPVITDLHHGSYMPAGVSEVDGTAVVDTFLVERIISLNVFGCPLSSHQIYLRDIEEEVTQKTNAEEAGKKFYSCGIWPMASYINHCCYCNAQRSFIGDMMVVRATQDLEPNTEITFWYHTPVANGYDERQKRFQHWGFKCDCAMCKDEQTTKKSVSAKRNRLGVDFKKHFHPITAASIAKIESIIAAIADTYSQPASKVPRLCLWAPQLVLTELYVRRKQPAKVIDSALAVLAALGYVIEGGSLPRTVGTPMVIKQWGLLEDSLVECWLHLCKAYRLVAPDLEKQAEQYARITYKIVVGEDETFDETFRNVLK